MKYEEIPYVEILAKEFATIDEIMQFLNISKAVFFKMKLKRVGSDIKQQKALYSVNELKKKINDRIEIFLNCEYVKGFPNYIVDKIRNIYSVKGKIIPYKLKHKIDRYGYPIVAPVGENGKKYIPVHKIVATTYIPNPLMLPQINHIDGNKLNSNVDNLEWCDIQYNIQHAFDNNLNKTGIESYNASPVIAYKNNGEIDAIFETCMSCGKHYGISEATVRGSHKNNTTKGFCGYFFRRITKEKFYEMKENKLYEQYFIKYTYSGKCQNHFRNTA